MGYAIYASKPAGKRKTFTCTNIGTAASINIKTKYPKVPYADLTVANFFYRISNASCSCNVYQGGYDAGFTGSFTAPSISYNKNNGVLSCGVGTVKIPASGVFYGGSANVSTTKYMCYLA